MLATRGKRGVSRRRAASCDGNRWQRRLSHCPGGDLGRGAALSRAGASADPEATAARLAVRASDQRALGQSADGGAYHGRLWGSTRGARADGRAQGVRGAHEPDVAADAWAPRAQVLLLFQTAGGVGGGMRVGGLGDFPSKAFTKYPSVLSS